VIDVGPDAASGSEPSAVAADVLPPDVLPPDVLAPDGLGVAVGVTAAVATRMVAPMRTT
jgi:hypothetical protein